jgi:hypothetical protein
MITFAVVLSLGSAALADPVPAAVDPGVAAAYAEKRLARKKPIISAPEWTLTEAEGLPIEGVVAAYDDGLILVGVPVEPEVAANLAAMGATVAGSAADVADGALFEGRYHRAFAVMPEAATEELAKLVGRSARIDLVRTEQGRLLVRSVAMAR